MEHYFSGSALGVVDRQGRVTLPSFIRAVLTRRSGDEAILFGRHEADPCLIGYDRPQVPQLAADLERRRLRDEAAGANPAHHHARMRRLFGFVTEAGIDRSGRVLLPALDRCKLGIERSILFIGVGVAFEVWSILRARDMGEGDVAELARFHLDQPEQPIAN